MNALDLVFSGKTLGGKTLEGSLITLHKPEGDEYYIHNGYSQKCSGYHYIPRDCQVLKETIKIIN